MGGRWGVGVGVWGEGVGGWGLGGGGGGGMMTSCQGWSQKALSFQRIRGFLNPQFPVSGVRAVSRTAGFRISVFQFPESLFRISKGLPNLLFSSFLNHVLPVSAALTACMLTLALVLSRPSTSALQNKKASRTAGRL